MFLSESLGLDFSQLEIIHMLKRHSGVSSFALLQMQKKKIAKRKMGGEFLKVQCHPYVKGFPEIVQEGNEMRI